jgi:hypothetical protein
MFRGSAWKDLSNQRRGGGGPRKLAVESLEQRDLMATGLTVTAPVPRTQLASAAAIVQSATGGSVTAPQLTAPTSVGPVREAVDKLFTDLKTIRAGFQFTPEMIAQFKSDLKTMLEGAQRPDPALVKQFLSDAAGALQDGRLSTKEVLLLKTDVGKIVQSAGIPQEEFNAVVDDLRTLAQASNVDRADLQLIADDLRAIAAALPSGHAVR